MRSERSARNVAGLLALAVAGCGGSDVDPNTNPNHTETTRREITADINGNDTWKKSELIVLKRHVFVENGTLTIEAGTKILGEAGTSLVITPTARIVAVGTAAEPIVFTSAQAEGSRAPGDWGGVVLLGQAPINISGGVEKIEGFPTTEGRTGYGGSNAAHDCGQLKYVRIEFAGFELAPDNELNGLTMGGCGSATQVDYVQVHKGADDGVELFGGAVSVRHVVITQVDDDGLDWDFGWVGSAQFLIIQQNPVVGNCGFEADNNKDTPNAEPRSAPEIWNATLVGSGAAPGAAGKEQLGMVLRRGTAGRLMNMLVTRFADFAVDIDGEPSAAQATAGNLVVKNSIFFQNAGMNEQWPSETDDDAGFDEQAFFNGGDMSNRFVDPQLTDPGNLTAPSFAPKPTSPALTGGATPPGGFFDGTSSFVGAMGLDDWTQGWTAYPER